LWFSFIQCARQIQIWSLDEIYEAQYPNSTQDKSKTMTILKNNLKWLKSKDAVEFPNNNSIKLVKYRLSSLIDGI
jgi:hypothetical protein